MRITSKKSLLIILIIIIVSAVFMLSRFGHVSADGTSTTETNLYKNAETVPMNQNDLDTSDTGSITSALVKLLGALIVVVAGIYGFLLLLRKMMGRKFSGNRKKNLLEVIETTYVAQKQSVSLVRFADRSVLIGVSEGSISVLAEVDAEETSKIIARTAVEANEKTGFASALNDARSKLIGFNMKGLRILNSSKKADGTQAA